MRLHFKPEGWLGARYRVLLDGDRGTPVAQLDLSSWRTEATLELPTRTLALRRDPLDGALVLLDAGVPEAQAIKTSVFSQDYDVEWPGGKGRLRSASGWGNTYVIEHAGREIARLKRSAWGTGRVEGTFPDDWPAERALFVSALALLAWRAQSAAIAAST